jgi:hypothetical protein
VSTGGSPMLWARLRSCARRRIFRRNGALPGPTQTSISEQKTRRPLLIRGEILQLPQDDACTHVECPARRFDERIDPDLQALRGHRRKASNSPLGVLGRPRVAVSLPRSPASSRPIAASLGRAAVDRGAYVRRQRLHTAFGPTIAAARAAAL